MVEATALSPSTLALVMSELELDRLFFLGFANNLTGCGPEPVCFVRVIR